MPKKFPLQNEKQSYPRFLNHCRSTKWVSISPHDGPHSVEETGGALYTERGGGGGGGGGHGLVVIVKELPRDQT